MISLVNIGVAVEAVFTADDLPQGVYTVNADISGVYVIHNRAEECKKSLTLGDFALSAFLLQKY